MTDKVFFQMNKHAVILDTVVAGGYERRIRNLNIGPSHPVEIDGQIVNVNPIEIQLRVKNSLTGEKWHITLRGSVVPASMELIEKGTEW